MSDHEYQTLSRYDVALTLQYGKVITTVMIPVELLYSNSIPGLEINRNLSVYITGAISDFLRKLAPSAVDDLAEEIRREKAQQPKKRNWFLLYMWFTGIITVLSLILLVVGTCK